AFRQNGDNVAQGLADLCDEVGRQITLTVPADYASGHHETSVGGHAVGVSLRRRPAAGLQDTRTGGCLAVRSRPHRASGRIGRGHKWLSVFGWNHSAARCEEDAPAWANCRRANRFSLPVSVLGSCATNSIARGYLYGATSRLTWSCNAVTSAASPMISGASTT